jgi:hypothetical protein
MLFARTDHFAVIGTVEGDDLAWRLSEGHSEGNRRRREGSHVWVPRIELRIWIRL